MVTVSRQNATERKRVDRAPRRALLASVAAGATPAEYLRAVLGWSDDDVSRALAEASHVAFGDA
jgi:hypothetical protein